MIFNPICQELSEAVTMALNFEGYFSTLGFLRLDCNEMFAIMLIHI